MEQWIKLSIWAAVLYASLFVADLVLSKIKARKKAVKDNDRTASNTDVTGDATCE